MMTNFYLLSNFGEERGPFDTLEQALDVKNMVEEDNIGVQFTIHTKRFYI